MINMDKNLPCPWKSLSVWKFVTLRLSLMYASPVWDYWR